MVVKKKLYIYKFFLGGGFMQTHQCVNTSQISASLLGEVSVDVINGRRDVSTSQRFIDPLIL